MTQTLGTASVQYGDLRGTVAIDGPDQEERLYELAALDRDEWFIVGYEIGGHYNRTYASVWAVPKPEVSYNRWADHARRGHTAIPARRFQFQLEDDDAALTLLKLNKRWSIHALFRSLVELELDVENEE